MGTFGEMTPGRGIGKEAEDEDSGQGGPLIPEGPLDLDSGVVVVRKSEPDPPADPKR